MSVFSQGACFPPTLVPLLPLVHTSSRYYGTPPTHLASVLLLQLLSHRLTALNKKDTSTCLLWMSLWPHISARPQLPNGRRGRAICPSCAATSALAGHAYSAAGQAASALHLMAVLQVFQAKMLANEEAGLDSASLRDLRSATYLALSATKDTTQAIGRSMSSLTVLERHLWLTMPEMKEEDKFPFLDAPISSGSLFGPAMEGFAERFTEAQKSSQAMRHYLPKHTSSSSASARGRSCSAQRYPFPKCQGPRPKIALDPAPQKSSWTARQKEEGPKSHYRWTTPQAASIVSLVTPA